jgi:hypothetical protein
MEPNDAATTLLQTIKVNTDAEALDELAKGLSAVAARMEAKDAPGIAGEAAATLLQLMKGNQEPSDVKWLADGLSAVAMYMAADDAAAVNGTAATILVEALKGAKEPKARGALAWGLSRVAASLRPKDAAQAVAILIRLIKDAKDSYKDARDPYVVYLLVEALSAVLARLETKEGAAVASDTAAVLLEAYATSVIKDALLLRALELILTGVAPLEPLIRGRRAAAAAALPAGMDHPLTALAFLPAAVPAPCRLSGQQLVGLLKMPTCVGDAQRVVLDQLGNRYHRKFADVWEFVRYAQEQHLDLDFTTPPQRPN